MGSINSIQYLRGGAALLVVYFHSLNFLADVPPYLVFGYQGVDIFFVISGFIISYSTNKLQGSSSFRDVLDFWVRRFVRVVPLYWVALAIEWRHDFVPSVNMFYDFMFIPRWHDVEAGRIWPKLIPGWTINYEVFFYFIFGIFLILRRGAWLVISVVLALSAVGFFFQSGFQDSPGLLFYTSSVLLEFAYGVLLAKFYRYRGWSGKHISNLWALLVFCGAIIALFADLSGPRGVVDGVPALLIVASALYIQLPGSVSILKVLGDSSYSLYLFHGFFFLAAGRVVSFLGLSEVMGVGFFVTAYRIAFACFGCWLVFFLLERPLTNAVKELMLRFRFINENTDYQSSFFHSRVSDSFRATGGYALRDFDYLPGNRLP